MLKREDLVVRRGASRCALALVAVSSRGASRPALTLAVVLFAFLSAFSEPLDSLAARAVAEGYWSAMADSSRGVDPGPLFTLNRIVVLNDRGNPVAMPVNGFTGAPASRKNLEALQAEVRHDLLNRGFPFAVIRSRVQIDSLKQNEVDVELRVHFGDAYKLGGLRLLETRTAPEVVRRLALWKIGEPYSEDRLTLGLNRLSRTGYFESVEMAGLFRDSTRNLLYPALRLPDLQDNQLSGLLGYDSKAQNGGQLTGYVNLHLVNLFGTARDLDFTFNSQPGGEREAHLAYVEPWIFSSSVGARVELDFLQQDSTSWEWNRNLILFQDLSFTSRMEIQFGDQENSNVGVQTHALRSGLSLIFDGRDRVPLTASGYRVQVGVTGVRRETGTASTIWRRAWRTRSPGSRSRPASESNWPCTARRIFP